MASIEQSTDQGRAIIYIHGRGFKPPTEVVQTLWTNALRRGLSRDFKKNGPVSKFNKATVDSAYYGDLSNDVRGAAGKSYDEVLDAADLENALATLVALESAKKFRRSGYERLPGHNSIKEFLADIGAPVLSTLGLTDIALSRSMPEVSAYWDATGAFCRESRERLLTPLRAALARGDKILLISHCLGSVIAYDCLWKLSHEAQSPLGKVDTWLTLGSPLGDEFVKRKLAGADQQGDERFPNNIVNWYNFAAEDDFTCHDETVANDFRPMLNSRLISRIKDFRIYNLAVRYGRSNPHTSVGYLTHPRVAKLLAEWL